MGTNIGYVMTLANGIIGVSILAMPFCFKQCGIILSILMLIVSGVLSRLACHFLLKSAIMARRRTFEFLAFHAFGPTGKFFVEIGIIGFLLGTCIAFFVVVGDLGPAIIANILNLGVPTETLRSTVMISLALFCVLPLGLLRNVDSLSSVCMATVGFYFCLVIKIILEALPHILFADWVDHVTFWRPVGILQCLPIFSMALFCQPQLFEIFGILPNASLDAMNSVVRGAVHICTIVYIFVGVFGYIAFCSKPFSGNILMSFTPSITTDIIKIGFVLSVAFSFPLVIFPCRASLHSLLFKKAQLPLDAHVSYIPELRFKWLTIIIVTISLITGLLIPSIELVLGLVGSTIGVMICVLFPATCFICMTTKNTNERIVAQIMLSVGILVMVLGTYANLYAMEEASIMSTTSPKMEPIINLQMKQDRVNSDVDKNILNKPLQEEKIMKPPVLVEDPKIKKSEATTKANDQQILNNEIKVDQMIPNEIRHEPPQPVEPDDTQHKLEPLIKEIAAVTSKKEEPLLNAEKTEKVVKDESKNSVDEKLEVEISTKLARQIESKKEEVDQEAIKKEDREIAEEAKHLAQTSVNPAQELFEKLKAQGQEQEKVLKEAKQVLAEIIEQKNELDRKQKFEEIEKKKAAMEIQKMADIAIERLQIKDKNNEVDLKSAIDLKPAENDLKPAKVELKQVQSQIKSVDNEVIKQPPEHSLAEILNLKPKMNETLPNKTATFNKQFLPIPLAKNNTLKVLNQNEIKIPKNAPNELKITNENAVHDVIKPNVTNLETKRLEESNKNSENNDLQKKLKTPDENRMVLNENVKMSEKQGESIPKRDILMEGTVVKNANERFKRDTCTTCDNIAK